MRSQHPNLVICSAAIANCMIVLVTLAIQGWSSAGSHAAARNSARFAAMWFVLAFAAPGLVRLVRGLPSVTTLLWAWFAAHLVHFATVAILIATFERPHIAQHPGPAVLVVLIGSSVVLGAALTAASHSPLHTVIHNISVYTVFVIFTLAFAHNRIPSLRLLAVALALALVLRLTARLKSAQASATSAG
jgi:hypothetical protein